MGNRGPENQPQEEIQIDEMTKLIFLSYRYSQGSQALQKDIYSYLTALHPEWTLSPRGRSIIADKLNKRINQFLHNDEIVLQPTILSHPQKSKQHVRGSIGEELIIFEDELNAGNRYKDFDIESLTKYILDRDIQFVRDGRERISPLASQASPIFNPRLSHIFHYGFEGNNAGAKEYDRMFKDITTFLRSTDDLQVTNKLGQLTTLVRRYSVATG